jgi:hypothetical protein
MFPMVNARIVTVLYNAFIVMIDVRVMRSFS